MEDQKATAKNIMLNYGALLGFISILISVTNYAVGDAYDQHWSIGVISLIIVIVIITLGLKKLKETNDGFLKLGEALKIGLGIALISGIIAVVYSLIFTNIIEPDFYSTMIQVQEQKWIDQGLTDEQIETAKVMMSKFAGPFMSSAFAIIGSLFFGFIISLIAGLIMKQSNEEITSI